MQKIQIDFNKLGKYLESLSYFAVWILFICFLKWLGVPTEQYAYELIISSLLVLLAGNITKHTSWRIGHDKFGISGDSRTRLINYHGNGNGDFWYDLFADNKELLENESVRSFMLKLSQKPDNDE